MRSMRVPAMLLGVVLLSTAGGLAWTATQTASEAASAQNTELTTASANTEVLVSEEFERAAAIGLQAVQDEIYQEFFTQPGTTNEKIARGGPTLEGINDRLAYLQTLFPG